MTSLVAAECATVIDDKNILHPRVNKQIGFCKNRHRKHALKSKENKYQHKCNKLLKRKLKKYKLRQDGIEDEDILDVSRILVSSLIIKSPNGAKESVVKEDNVAFCDELRPKNYLFKMVRRKEITKSTKIVRSTKIDESPEMPEVISQEKKHTNAFQLLMDSRNKSIGNNSPGKEKNDDQSDSEDVLEKKNTKAKRQLLLQKMAEAKGSLKNKQMEEVQDKIIKRKMDKRAERLKTMILKETKPAKLNADSNIANCDTSKSERNDSEVSNNNKSPKTHKGWKIVDIFNTIDDPINISPEKKHIPKEDKEFLNKLSPSMKKKESMLSYFKKVDKDIEPDPSSGEPENDNIIKVKFQSNTKKRGRKKKLSLKRDTINDLPEVNDENNILACELTAPKSEIVCVIVEDSGTTNERQKRKRNTKIDKKFTDIDNAQVNNDNRPKRSIKRPVKYTDDAYLSSSDEDLHIFTPKKKKHADSHNEVKLSVNKCKKIDCDSEKSTSKKKADQDTNTPKKPVKLAPIFGTKIDPAALEAKQKFLQSGVPDKLKKVINSQKENSKVSNDFPKVVHIQQISSFVENSSKFCLHIVDDDIDYTSCPLTSEESLCKKLLDLNKVFPININDTLKKSTQTILQNIKQLHPKFPVYRTYHYLRGKSKGEFKDCATDFDNSIEVISDMTDDFKDSPDRLNWTDKYKATSTNKIIGNFESIKELRKWLISWTENEMKSKSRGNTGSDSSDYYQSDTDSRESLKSMNNLLILTGPTGCGKTSSVYAVAAELAIKVIEVNASSKRTGKIMLQDLQEATQSHKVNRATGTDNSQKSQEKNLTDLLKKGKKRGRPKKTVENSTKKSAEKAVETLNSTPSSQESTRTGMSLILIDDADIVFDQDDGFSSAIVQLVQCSKRPVILITTSLVCPHLQKFIQNGKILKMNPLLPKMLGTWLDILCLADSGISWPGVASMLLSYFNGDIRKTINYLQFYTLSYAQSLNSEEERNSQNVDYYKNNIDDENSSMSWADSDDLEKRKLMPVCYNNIDIGSNPMWADFVEKHLNLSKYTYPTQLFNIWWSVPQLLCTGPSFSNALPRSQSKDQNVKELEAIADAIDAISLSDYITHAHPESKCDISTHPWYSSENDSVSEQDNVDYYMSQHEVTDAISRTLVTSRIAAAQDIMGCHRKTELTFPGMSMQRERDKVVSRHKTLTSYLNPSAILDRKSLALDYWSSCRTICRLEKSKNDFNLNTKRNNRFCHYLKSLNVLCKSDTLDNLCHSLSNEGTELNN